MKKLRENFATLMLELGRKNKDLCVMVGDISHGILQPFAKEFPDRYYNIGICEPSMINIGAGMSKVGLLPVMHTIAPFIAERSYEQIKLDYGYQGLGGNFITIKVHLIIQNLVVVIIVILTSQYYHISKL